MNPMIVWTGDDYENHKCRADQIGTPKPVQETQSAELDALAAELPPSTMAELKQAALRVARGKMGYDEFLQKNPTFHQKFLLAMAKESERPSQQPLTVNISWLNPDRLSYKQSSLELVQDTQSTKVIEHQPSGWKSPPPEQGLGHILRSEDLPES